MTRTRSLFALAALLVLAACAAHQVPEAVHPGAPGFWLGLWHGFIFPVAFFLSLVLHDVSVYAVPNNGLFYNIGYFIGVVFLGVGANRGRKVVVRERVAPRGTVIDHE